MSAPISIVVATVDAARACPAIEKAGAQMFCDSPFPEIAEEPMATPDRFVAAAAEGLLLVALRYSAVVGFARLELDGADLLIAEFDVLPAHQGGGVGAALLDGAEALGRDRGAQRLTLTTFRSVPWNRAYYERRGFAEIALESGGAQLRREARQMAAAGYGPNLRLAMARSIRSQYRDKS